MLDRGDSMKKDAAAWLPDRLAEFAEVVITPPTRIFDTVDRIDLGPVSAELSYHGQGHTDADIVVTVGDVSFMGDLLEEARPGVRRRLPVELAGGPRVRRPHRDRRSSSPGMATSWTEDGAARAREIRRWRTWPVDVSKRGSPLPTLLRPRPLSQSDDFGAGRALASAPSWSARVSGSEVGRAQTCRYTHRPASGLACTAPREESPRRRRRTRRGPRRVGTGTSRPVPGRCRPPPTVAQVLARGPVELPDG